MFTTVEQARQQAARRLPGFVRDALVAGSERGLTGPANVAAFAQLALPRRIGAPVQAPGLSTTVLGRRLAMPVLISPVGVQGVAPSAEIALARAAAAYGVPMGLSCFAGSALRDVVAAHAETLYQVHWIGSRAFMAEQLQRAQDAGAVGLVATLDWTFSHGRDTGSPSIPRDWRAQSLLRLSAAALAHPRWSAGYLRTRTLPTLTAPNLAAPGAPPPDFFDAYADWQRTAPPTWDDVAWLVQQWPGPLLLKGVLRPDDARRAADAGVRALSVSNHGGNNLDGTPATIRLLGGVVDAVGGEVEVLLDGGVRCGADVVRALGLGARAVLVGRAVQWGLAAAGQAGAERVLAVLADGIDGALRRLGRRRVGDVVRADVVVPPGFELSVG